MGSYYKHKRTESIDVPYSFCCEQCMKDSGPLTATISAQAELNSNFKNLNEKKQEKLREMAHANLVHEVKQAHSNAEEKQIYSKAFKDECPHCHKPQSWAVGAMKNDMFSVPTVILIVAAIFAAGCYFFSGVDNSLQIALGVAVIGVVAALAALAVNMVKIGSKKKKTSTAIQQNAPVIEWRAVQHLLDE